MIIMKFGGTSVGTAEAINEAALLVRDRLEKNPIVVVSAFSGVTNALIRLVESIEKGDEEGVQGGLRYIEHRHNNEAKKLFKNFSKVEPSLKYLNTELKTFVDGLVIIREVSARSYDKAVSFGEHFSAILFAEHLKQLGVDAEVVEARDVLITDDHFTKATPLFDETFKRSKAVFMPLLSKGIVPVTQGFIGGTKEGLITTLGRGGSDYSASIFGTVLSAKEIQIWSDVDGVMTTDPRIVNEALLVPEITFEEASELAYFGAKVLHPSTILPAVEKKIPVFVYNTKNPTSPGTKITDAANMNGPVRAIACKKGITMITVNSSRMLLAHGFLKAIFEVFDRHQTSVDLVSTSEVNVSLTIDNAVNIKEIEKDLEQFGELSIEKDRAIVCVVGEGMKSTPGIAARIFASIPDVNVNMISQGASEINLSLIVKESEADKAVCALHREFFG